jgi:hypothetical protein
MIDEALAQYADAMDDGQIPRQHASLPISIGLGAGDDPQDGRAVAAAGCGNHAVIPPR